MDINYIGLITAVGTFLTIGLFHPIVIVSEYHFGTRCWWWFLLAGLCFVAVSLFVENQIVSTLFGVVGCSCLWSILEIFEQRKRVLKGWFPMNPERAHEYEQDLAKMKAELEKESDATEQEKDRPSEQQ